MPNSACSMSAWSYGHPHEYSRLGMLADYYDDPHSASAVRVRTHGAPNRRAPELPPPWERRRPDRARYALPGTMSEVHRRDGWTVSYSIWFPATIATSLTLIRASVGCGRGKPLHFAAKRAGGWVPRGRRSPGAAAQDDNRCRTWNSVRHDHVRAARDQASRQRRSPGLAAWPARWRDSSRCWMPAGFRPGAARQRFERCPATAATRKASRGRRGPWR